MVEVAEAVGVALAPRYGERPERRSSLEIGELGAHSRFIQGFGRDAVWFRYMPEPA
jgi:hypothetical protein